VRRLPLTCAVLVLFAGVARAGDAPTADAVTEPGRSLARALDVVLAGSGAADGKRTVLFLLDAAPALSAAGFADAFTEALARMETSREVEIGIAVMGAKKPVLLAPTPDRAKAAEAVATAMKSPSGAYQNVMDDIRKAASSLAGRSGARELIVVTLENGDAEDDIEATVAALRRAKVRCSCISREAFLADTFWTSGVRGAPRGIEFGAGDDAYVTLPWGWLWQMTIANENTPSGFGTYGLSRLAAETEGRVFLEAPPSSGHVCTSFGMCNACSGDHLPRDEAFHSRRLKALAPSTASRKDLGADLARDPCFRLVLKAWGEASKAGLLRSRPSVRLATGGVKPERRQDAPWAPILVGGLGFARMATKADALVRECDRQISWLTAELGKLDAKAGSERNRAMAEFTLAMLHVTRTNLLACGFWCREVGPALVGKADHEIQAPELDPVIDADRVVGVGYTNFCLCHGVKPFFEMRMPGGTAWDDTLKALDEVFEAYMQRWAHTPYAMALRHQSIARFQFTYRGTTAPPPPRPRKGSDSETPTTESGNRPSRSGSPSTGSGSGSPTTGGG